MNRTINQLIADGMLRLDESMEKRLQELFQEWAKIRNEDKELLLLKKLEELRLGKKDLSDDLALLKHENAKLKGIIAGIRFDLSSIEPEVRRAIKRIDKSMQSLSKNLDAS